MPWRTRVLGWLTRKGVPAEEMTAAQLSRMRANIPMRAPYTWFFGRPERGVTSQAVTHWLRTFQVTLTQKYRGPNFVHTYKPKFRCPAAWGLTDQQAQIVAILVDDGEVSNAVALERITSEETDDKILDVVLCHTRKKLARFNINLHRRWGKGIFLDPVQRKRLRAGAVTLKPSERTP